MSVVQAKCPKCGHPASVDETVAALPVACEKCGAAFTPAAVAAESNRKFEIGMYVVMLLVGVGLVAYMMITGQGLPKPKPADAPPAAAAEDAAEK